MLAPLTKLNQLRVKTKSLIIIGLFIVALLSIQLFNYLLNNEQQRHQALLHQSQLEQKHIYAIAFMLNEISDGEQERTLPLHQHMKRFETYLEAIGAHDYGEENQRIHQNLSVIDSEWQTLQTSVEQYLMGLDSLQQARSAILDSTPPLAAQLFSLGLDEEAQLLFELYRHASDISPHQLNEARLLEQANTRLQQLLYNVPGSPLYRAENQALLQQLRLQLTHANTLAKSLYHKDLLFSALHQHLPKIEKAIDAISGSIQRCTERLTQQMFLWGGIISAISLLLLLIVSFHLVSGVSLPLQCLTTTIRNIVASGNRTERIAIDGTCEFKQLSKDINQLLDEQQNALNSAEQSKALFQDMVESTSEWLWEVNHQTEYTYCSTRIKELLGYEADEIIGRTPLSLMPPHEAQRVGAKFADIIANRAPFHGLINTNLHRDGHEVILETSGIPLLTAEGELRGYRGIDRDVTAKVMAERQLKLERNLFLAGRIVAFRWRADDMWSIEYASPNLQKIFGYDAREWIEQGFPFSSLIHPDDLDSVANDPHDYAPGGEEFVEHEYRLRHADGSWHWVYDFTAMQQGDKGEVTHYYGYLLDITARREMEERMRLAATAFETREAIVIVTTDAKIERTNQSFTAITGYSAEEALGQPISLLSSGRHDEAFYQQMWQALIKEGYWEGEIWNRRKNGEVYPEWLAITSVFNDAGKVSHYVGTFQDITDRKNYENQIINHAYYDSLTGLPNRRFLLENIGRNMIRLKRHGHYGALLFFDLDLFKTINDSLGHQVGDQVLKIVAERIRSRLRSEDIAVRLGGDEFVVLLTEVADSEYDTALATEVFVSELQAVLSEPCLIDEHTLYVSASIGISLYPNDSDSVDDLLKHADVAMYRAKEQGRNTFQFYLPSMQEQANKRLMLEREMREAIRDQLFDVYFQPQLNSGHQLIGAEALVRWMHPEQGAISPAEFIPVAEETGLIFDISDYVLRATCRQLRQLEQNGKRHLELVRIAVNISAKQFMQRDFVERVLAIIREEQVKPGNIELEITEGVLLHDINESIRKILALREAGISFSIDDFGTGYSSLSYLSKLPIDKLKIDQSFVRDMGSDPAAAAIVETIIAMTRHLGIDVIAEGVETELELKLLQQQGCHKFQGYHFSRPLTAEAFNEFVQQQGESATSSSQPTQCDAAT